MDAGIGETGIRPGIFGEIGTSDPVQPAETRFLQGVAAAAAASGLAISVHLHPWGHEGRAVLDTLTAAGADPARVILGHCNTAIDRPDDLRALADRGATLGFDLFGFDHSLLGPGRWPPSDRDVATVVAALVGDGYGGPDRARPGHRCPVTPPPMGQLGLRPPPGARRARSCVSSASTRTALDAMLVRNPARLLAVRAAVA